MNSIFKNIIAILTGNVFSKILAFITSVYIARIWGEKIFGITNFANSIVMYFIMIASMGLQTYAIVKISKEKNKETINKTFNEILSSSIVLSIFSFLLLLIFLILSTSMSREIKIVIFFYGLTIISSGMNLNWYFNAIKEIKCMSIALVIQNAMALLLLLALNIIVGTNIYLIPITLFIGAMASDLFLILKLKGKIKFKFEFSIKKLIKFIQISFPFFFSGIFATINCNIDTIILGYMSTNTEVGLYSAAYKIVNMFIIIPSIIFTPIYPVLVNLFSKNDKVSYESLRNISNTIRKIVLIISIPMFLLAAIFSKGLIVEIFGAKYIDATGALIILIMYIGVFYIRELYGYSMNACGLQKKYMRVVCISSAINIILNILLIPKIGIIGAAITTLISEIINLICMKYFMQKYKKIKYENKYLLKIIPINIILVLISYLLLQIKINVFIIGITISIIYIVVLILFKVIKREDIKILKEN